MGVRRIYRSGRRRVRCVTRGHRWRRHDRVRHELLITAERCVRCGRVEEHAVRPLYAAAPADST
jgi:hypothetical protein